MARQAEHLTFHFSGDLAEQHRLNFYEAARFQYAAARLLVKLEQFRETGRFSQKITGVSNRDILLKTHKDGSFEIGVIIPVLQAAQEAFIGVPISALMTYVFERIFGKTNDDKIIAALNVQKEIIAEFGKIREGDVENLSKALEIIQEDQKIKSALYAENKDLIEMRLSEMERESLLIANRSKFRAIDSAREQRLIAMASPLVSEMATPLRKSSSRLEIFAGQRSKKRIFYLNKEMADDVELAIVDKEITSLLVNIVQYNKETGWGKLRSQLSSTTLSFNVPSDRKDQLQRVLLNAMGSEETYVQTYIVRDKSKAPLRLIVVGLIDLAEEKR